MAELPDQSMTAEPVAIAELRPHPRNYREHPADQLEHLKASIVEHGLYRNVVIARDGTILAGHGVVQAATALGLETVPAYRLDVGPDDPAALKVLIGDNEIEHLGERDDRLLSELLREVGTLDLDNLLGTGYDELMLANLVMVTRPASEIADFDAAAEWVGLPEYRPEPNVIKLTIAFDSAERRREFLDLIGVRLEVDDSSFRWPVANQHDDVSSVRFSDADA